MGLATLFKLTGALFKTKGNAPGNATVMTAEGYTDQTMETEVYQAPGVFAMPGDGAKGVWLPVGNANRWGVVIAMHNYSLNIEIAAGETAIYSTDAGGSSTQALIKLKADGKIEFNGNSKRLVTWQELQTALSTFASTISGHTHPETGATTGPSPALAALSIDIESAKTTTLKTGG